ncbi:MAG: hypothetical protein R3E87_14155 [Burkholderiaceae bacterium]
MRSVSKKTSSARGGWLLMFMIACLVLAGAQSASGAGEPRAADAASLAADAYDPLALADGAVRSFEDLDLALPGDERRVLPVRVYRPLAHVRRRGLILFSHGLGGSRAAAGYLGRHWAARGYMVLVLQHPGSDAAVWRDLRGTAIGTALRAAATPEQLLRRVRDVQAVLDVLAAPGEGLAKRLGVPSDETRIGMAGHSFGARTTQIVAGQWVAGYEHSLTVPRVRAAVVLSPSSPNGVDPGRSFGAVRTPWLLLTGTRDEAAIGARLPERLTVFPALPVGGKYELVLDGARHTSFVDQIATSPGSERSISDYHDAIAAFSTAFWDAWLDGDTAARAWLDGDRARGMLEPGDRWQLK